MFPQIIKQKVRARDHLNQLKEVCVPPDFIGIVCREVARLGL